MDEIVLTAKEIGHGRRIGTAADFFVARFILDVVTGQSILEPWRSGHHDHVHRAELVVDRVEAFTGFCPYEGVGGF